MKKSLNYKKLHRMQQRWCQSYLHNVFCIIVATMIYTSPCVYGQIIGDNPLMDMRYRVENISNNGSYGYFDVVFQVRTTDGSSYIVTQMQNSIELDPHFRSLITSCDTSYWAVPSQNYVKIWNYNNSDGVLDFQMSYIDMRPGNYFGSSESEEWQTVVRFSFVCTRELGNSGTIDWFEDTPHFNVRAFNPATNRTELIHNREIGGPVEIDLAFYPKVMDIRMRKGLATSDGSTGSFKLWFEMRTSDGSNQYIYQLQDAVVFDPSLQDHIVSVEHSESVFEEPNYGTFWRYTQAAGVLEFQVFHREFRPFVVLGGPDSTNWHAAICFNIIFNLDPGQQGFIDWYDGTPHLNIRVANPGPPPTSDVIHRYELGAPLGVSFDVQPDITVTERVMDMRIRKGQMTLDGQSGRAELWVDVRSIDGSSHTICQLQNAVQLDSKFRSMVLSVEQNFSAFPVNDYQTTWNWTKTAGVLEFNSIIKMNGRPTYLGGPDTENWHPVYRFDVTFILDPEQNGVINYYDYTPDFFISTLGPSGYPDEIQHKELAAPLSIPLYGQADLGVECSVDKTTVGLNDEVNFQLSVINNSTNHVENIIVTDLLPQELTFVSSDDDGEYSPETGEWSVSHLDGNSRKNFVITAKATQTGCFINFCRITTGNEYDPVPGNDQASQSVIVSEETRIFVRMYLEGPYRFAISDLTHPSSEYMATKLRYPSLNSECLIPLISPYTDSLYRECGVDSPDELPDHIVDWVYIQFRPANEPYSPCIILSNGCDGISCFLRHDGALIDLDGSEGVVIPGLADGLYFILINHRNHLQVMTSVAVNTFQLNRYNFGEPVKQYYDFSDDKTKYFRIHNDNQRGCRITPINNKWVIAAGDGDGANQVESADLDIWYENFGNNGYYASDYDLGGMVEGRDQSLATDNLLLRSPFSWPDMNP
ncbi:DUF11 domain-containing protein [candidate division KSB1 bacterium]|nr:DUF11 domain-containing protein [candidate division KSB1 bacterium]